MHLKDSKCLQDNLIHADYEAVIGSGIKIASSHAIWWMARLRKRRRWWQAAICHGEPHAGIEPWIA